jgi:hypothetical protein
MPQRIASQLAAVRAQLEHTDATQESPAQIGALILAIGTLVDVVELISEQVADLARVQNERASD